MPEIEESSEIKDLIKKKSRLAKDSQRLTEYGDVLFQIGYLYYNKGYYKEALDEFEHTLDVRKKLSVNVDLATTYRFIGETLTKLGTDLERAKLELSKYHSIALKINDLVEIQRAHTTLGNYFMSLAENNYKDKRKESLNEAYSHYLKSYDLINEIAEKRLVDTKELNLIKARTCLNCAFAMDEKRDEILCNEYLGTAIQLCEAHHFYEDLIRCFYIKCDQARRKNKMEEHLKMADRIIETTLKTKDYVQQSQDFLFTAEIYVKVQNFEKAKLLLRKAYRLKKKCLINQEITQKLKDVIKLIRSQRDLNQFFSAGKELESLSAEDELKLTKIYEKLGDAYCGLGLFEIGLKNYLKQLSIAEKLSRPNSEMALIFSSIGQTYQDLDNYREAIKYFERELQTFSANSISECKSLMNIAVLQEKLHLGFTDVKETYFKALKKAKEASNLRLQLKILKLFKDCQKVYGIEYEETNRMIHEVDKQNAFRSSSQEENSSSSDDEAPNDDNEDNESLVFSSESEEDEMMENELIDEEKKVSIGKQTRLRSNFKVKRNLRGETQLHVACIRGNFKMANKLIEEGHPLNERDNLNWLPLHEACNYGYLDIVELLVKSGAKVNDSIGPITPLHDAAQNGHFQVVKVLLKAGALCYVFSHDGYTPLDFLCKYKEDNERSMSTAELELFQELYETMFHSIRGKDKMYKVKKVLIAEDESYITDNESSMNSKPAGSSAAPSSHHSNYKSTKQSKSDRMKSLLYSDDDDESDDIREDSDEPPHNEKADKKKKTKAVCEYREAMTRLAGGKSNSLSANMSSSKKCLDKVLITESEFSANENWLIEDMEKRSENVTLNRMDTHERTSSTKRKYAKKADKSESENEESVRNEKYSSHLNEDEEDDEHDYLMFKKNRNSANSPMSKKRLIDDEENCEGKVFTCTPGDFYFTQEDSNDVSKALSINERSPLKSNNLNSLFNKDNKHTSVVDSNEESKHEDDLAIISPFKKSKFASKHKTQLKITSMVKHCSLKSSTDHDINEIMVMRETLPRLKDTNTSTVSTTRFNDSSDKNQTWKIKAIVENKNFLIPVSNISLTIDDLTAQIVTRYKTIFSSDPTYREPEKVILKSSDDLILFGQDLIKDVLSNMCQVKLVIESWKDAPKLAELFEEMCSNKGLQMSTVLNANLKESETSFTLNMSQMSSNYLLTKQYAEVVIESVRSYSKQPSNFYLRNLVRLNLSRNMLTDEIVIDLFNLFLFETHNLKMLDLSFNLVGLKSLKQLTEMTNMIKSNTKLNLFPLEYLNLNGNEIGSACNPTANTEFLNNLASLVSAFQTLQTLKLSDCSLELDRMDERSQAAVNRLMSSIKASNLIELDISYNNFSYKLLQCFIDALPESQIETLNLSNSLSTKQRKILVDANRTSASYEEIERDRAMCVHSLVRFISFNLKSFSIRNLGFNVTQMSDIINCLTGCKQLRHADLSYNQFETNLLRLLFDECGKLEEGFFINTNSDIFQTSWCELLLFKFDENTSICVPFKRLELNFQHEFDKNREISQIKSFFKKKWQKADVKCKLVSKNSMEFYVC